MGALVLYCDSAGLGAGSRWGLYHRSTLKPHSRMWYGKQFATYPFEKAVTSLQPHERRCCPLEMVLLTSILPPQVYYD